MIPRGRWSLDETSKQLLKETRAPIAMWKGQPRPVNYEYERNGTASIFMIFAPLEGRREAIVTERHTAIDYAHALKHVADQMFPRAEKIVLVQDNLNTHKPSSLYQAFAPQEARRLAYSPEVLSVFDTLVGPLRTHTEKTYSEPFALTLYAKESMTDAQGNIQRDYRRLQYGGAHLADVSQRDMDVAKRALIGGGLGLLVGLLSFYLTHRTLRCTSGCDLAVSIATLVLTTLIGAVVSLAAVYHVLGTDKVGQDVLYLSLKSIRTDSSSAR